MLASFKWLWSWWISELSGLLPERVKDFLLCRPEPLLIAPMQAAQHREAGAIALCREALADAQSSLDGRDVVLRLPKEVFLTRSRTLPSVARRRVAEIMAIDLSRTSILDPETVTWRCRTSPSGDGSIQVEQLLLRNDDVACIRELLNAQGARLRRVELGGTGGEPALVFDVASDGARIGGVWRRINLGLAVASSAAIAFAVIWPALAAQREAAALQREIAELSSEAVTLRGRVQALREKQERDRELAVFVNGETKFVDALRELTLRLPDSVWVSELEFRPGAIRFGGTVKGSAAEQTIALSRSPMFDDPRLTGPVSMLAASSEERFEIALRLTAPEYSEP